MNAAADAHAAPLRLDSSGSSDGAPRLPGGFSVPFEEAIAWARGRKAVLPAEFYGARLQAVRARSFTVTGLATLDQVQTVADAAAAATASGQTFRDWQRAVLTTDRGGELFGLGRARRELIFRNAVQTNYGIGRTIQQRENAAARPYLMWDAINDGRTRPAHAAMDNHIAPMDAPIWRKWSPPAGHQCRCTRISLTEAQARVRGYPKVDPGVEPDKGWDGDPTDGNEDLVRVVQARLDSCGGVGLAARGPRSPGLHCIDGGARDRLLQASALLERDGAFPPLAPPGGMTQIPAAAFSRPALYRRFVDAVEPRIAGAVWMRDLAIDVQPDKSLFLRQDGSWKIGKNSRARWIDFLADTLIDPAEVRWVDTAPNAPVELRLLGGYLYGGRPLHTLLAFKLIGRQWQGESAYNLLAKNLGPARASSVLAWVRK